MGYNLVMAEIQVRPATAEDLPLLGSFDHGYSTDYVWQMDLRDESSASAAESKNNAIIILKELIRVEVS